MNGPGTWCWLLDATRGVFSMKVPILWISLLQLPVLSQKAGLNACLAARSLCSPYTGQSWWGFVGHGVMSISASASLPAQGKGFGALLLLLAPKIPLKSPPLILHGRDALTHHTHPYTTFQMTLTLFGVVAAVQHSAAASQPSLWHDGSG